MNIEHSERKLISQILTACCCLILVLAARTISFYLVSPAETRRERQVFSFLSSFDCHTLDDNSEGCIAAQSEGRGCAWYSDCRLCVKNKIYSKEEFDKMCNDKKSGLRN